MFRLFQTFVAILSECCKSRFGCRVIEPMAASTKLTVALHRRTCRVMFAHVRDPRVGPHRAATLRLNQRHARLPHHRVRGLLRASSGAGKGAPSG
jgi:hypothetical protein